MPGLQVIPAGAGLAGANVELPRDRGLRAAPARAPGAAARAASATSCWTARRRLGPLTVGALVAADRVIVPVQTEYFALEGLAGLLDTLALIQRELNPRLTVAGMLLTMHDNRTRLGRDVEREVREHFPELVFSTVIPRNVRVGEAPSYGLAGDSPRPPQRGRRGLLRAGKGGGGAWLGRSPGWAEGCRRSWRCSADAEAEQERRAARAAAGADRAEPDAAAAAFRRGRAAGAGRLAGRARRAAAGARAPEGRRDVTSWSPASDAGARRRSPGLRDDSGAGAPARRRRSDRARADREHGARGSQPDRGGARMRGARRGARA